MPYVKKIYDNFKKQYGDKASDRFYQWLEERPEIAKKALATARKKGDKLIDKIPKQPIKKTTKKKAVKKT